MSAGHPLFQSDRGLIIAADVSTLDDLKDLINITSGVPEVVAVKVGFSLALRFGLPSVVRAVHEVSDIPVIYDHQKGGTDIPAMGRSFAETCLDAGVQGVIFFPLTGPKTLESFVSAAFDNKLLPIVGSVMTHSAYLQSDGGFITDIAPEAIFKIALDLGVKDIVLPGNKPDILRNFSEGQLKATKPLGIMMPGIGSQGGTIIEAFKSVEGHYPFAIIGSAIYMASNPKASLEKFAAEIRR